MAELLVTCVRGLEEVTCREIFEITKRRCKKAWSGALRLKANYDDVFHLNYLSKTISRVIVLLAVEEFESLDDIYKVVKNIDFTKFIESEQSFAVRSKREGKHDFTSIDVARVVGQAIIDSYRDSTKKRLRVNLDEPDVVVRCYVKQKLFIIGIDTTGDKALYKRGYRRYQHPASLNPAIANSMVRISEFKEEESFIDPFCGGGTICIEAVHYICGVPNFFRNDYAFWKLKFLDTEKFRKIKEKIDEKVFIKELNVNGCDLFEKHVKGAFLNAESAKVKINFFKCNATKIKLDYDRIVSNLPFGLRIGRKSIVNKLYKDFQKNLKKSCFKRCVLLVADYKNFEFDRKIDIVYGNLPAHILIIEG